jgi:hypothetical protein
MGLELRTSCVLEPLCQPCFVLGIFKIGLANYLRGLTEILMISASQVAKITGVGAQLFFRTGSHHSPGYTVELTMLLESPQALNYRCAPPCPAHYLFQKLNFLF